jgi:hypothetical protein
MERRSALVLLQTALQQGRPTTDRGALDCRAHKLARAQLAVAINMCRRLGRRRDPSDLALRGFEYAHCPLQGAAAKTVWHESLTLSSSVPLCFSADLLSLALDLGNHVVQRYIGK